MKTLYLVHIENMFQNFLDGEFIFDTIKEIVTGKYDKVVAVCSYIEGLESVPEWLVPGVTEEEEWSWGYENDCYCGECTEDILCVIPASGHEYTYIPEFLINEVDSGNELYIGGGHRDECLADFIDILDHLGLSYTVLDDLVYG